MVLQQNPTPKLEMWCIMIEFDFAEYGRVYIQI